MTDSQVEGIWLALDERLEFSGFLLQHRGSIPALSRLLEMCAEQLRGSSAE